MYNTTQESTLERGNTGLQKYKGDVGKVKYYLFVNKGTEIATKTLALNKSTYVDNINEAIGDRWYLFAKVWDVEPTQADSTKRTSGFGFEEEVMKGKLTEKITLDSMSTYNKTQLAIHDGRDYDVYKITEKDYIQGFSYDNTKFLPFELDYVAILPETPKTGEANPHVQVEIRYSDTTQMNRYAVDLNPYNDEDQTTPWRPSIELSGIKDLRITIDAMTATTIDFTVKGYDGVPYSGVVAGDLYLRKTTEDGVAITVTSPTEGSTKGSYSGTLSSQTEGTFYLSLKDQPSATTKGVETPVVASYVLNINS